MGFYFRRKKSRIRFYIGIFLTLFIVIYSAVLVIAKPTDSDSVVKDLRQYLELNLEGVDDANFRAYQILSKRDIELFLLEGDLQKDIFAKAMPGDFALEYEGFFVIISADEDIRYIGQYPDNLLDSLVTEIEDKIYNYAISIGMIDSRDDFLDIQVVKKPSEISTGLTGIKEGDILIKNKEGREEILPTGSK